MEFEEILRPNDKDPQKETVSRGSVICVLTFRSLSKNDGFRLLIAVNEPEKFRQTFEKMGECVWNYVAMNGTREDFGLRTILVTPTLVEKYPFLNHQTAKGASYR